MDIREYCDAKETEKTEKAYKVCRCNYNSLVGTPVRRAQMTESYNDAMLYMNWLHAGKESGVLET